jgi:hypothetical protein
MGLVRSGIGFRRGLCHRSEILFRVLFGERSKLDLSQYSPAKGANMYIP